MQWCKHWYFPFPTVAQIESKHLWLLLGIIVFYAIEIALRLPRRSNESARKKNSFASTHHEDDQNANEIAFIPISTVFKRMKVVEWFRRVDKYRFNAVASININIKKIQSNGNV